MYIIYIYTHVFFHVKETVTFQEPFEEGSMLAWENAAPVPLLAAKP